ncbi:lipid II flippase MurJ [Streptomyces sp. NPDC095613]|uniref:murein biosynthesis integral membrane protein MurJ n=1 Tax=Streptomyces sp. NPDC095613 TaxID=3155540 RepID=UPI00331842E9
MSGAPGPAVVSGPAVVPTAPGPAVVPKAPGPDAAPAVPPPATRGSGAHDADRAAGAVGVARDGAGGDSDGSPRAARASFLSGRLLARAAVLAALATAVASLLGLVRDQTIARLYGAGHETDAFLVAWTVPEVASTLLIEDGMALVLVPAFSMALARRAAGRGPDHDPVRALLRSTLPRLLLALSAVAALLVAAAPWVVAVLAPGLPETELAVDCTRLTATCVLSFGVAGYLSAALRAHGRFVVPASIYIAYNLGIIATMLLAGGSRGVGAAAAGVAVGGVLMVLFQAPVLWRRLREAGPGRKPVPVPVPVSVSGPSPDLGLAPVPTPLANPVADPAGTAAAADTVAVPATEPARGEQPPRTADSGATPVVFALIAPVVAFALCRQSQVLVERFLAAPLPAGAISHLNYAQKVAQMPMVLSLMICTVTFPVVSRAMAAGETGRARRRVERDLALAAIIVLIGAAAVIACAPQFIDVLFQRGAFDHSDTAATAAVMRVYAVGLLGHTLVGALVRCYFSAARPLWFPALAMLGGLALTAGTGALLLQDWGVLGIAAANALGITSTAAVMLYGLRRHSVPIRTRRTAGVLIRLAVAAAAAVAAGWFCASLVPAPVLGAAAGCTAVAAVFLGTARALRVPETDTVLRPLLRPLLRLLTRKCAHAR